MTIKRLDITEPIEWTEEYLIEVLGVKPIDAEFIVAINTGEIDGDEIGGDIGLGIAHPASTKYLEETKQKEPDTTLRAASSRLPMWINRYNEVMNTAKLMAGENVKLMWVLGKTEHCSSCLKLAGKVKRKREWLAAGIQPQSRSLECGGFNCQCSLQPTSARASPGRLPGLP